MAGVGALFINSVRFVDVPVMAAYLMMIALVFVVINLIVDLLYYAVDPRLRVDRAARALMGQRPMATPARSGPVSRRLWDSDMMWSFRHSPVAVVAARWSR